MAHRRVSSTARSGAAVPRPQRAHRLPHLRRARRAERRHDGRRGQERRRPRQRDRLRPIVRRRPGRAASPRAARAGHQADRERRRPQPTPVRGVPGRRCTDAGDCPDHRLRRGDNVLGRLDELCALRLRSSPRATSSATSSHPPTACSRSSPTSARVHRRGARSRGGHRDHRAWVDSAAALGALVYEFGWSFGDLDRMAAGSMIGHVIECGRSDGRDIHRLGQREGWSCPSSPIAECREDGWAVHHDPGRDGWHVHQ